MQALTYLQRALLVHDLQKLDALEWESCFNKVGLSTGLKVKFISLRLEEPGSLRSPSVNPQPASYLPFCSVPIHPSPWLPWRQGCQLLLLGRCWLFTHQVLFPLLTKLLENISPADVGGMEETRMRASTLLSKVLLTTLHPPTFLHQPLHKEGSQGFLEDLEM